MIKVRIIEVFEGGWFYEDRACHCVLYVVNSSARQSEADNDDVR